MGDRRATVLWALGYAGLVILPPEAMAETRGVIELFTSQGCSSCPPADKLLSELSADPSIVAISLPIDYWDYLGWKDTLAIPRHTVLQRAYARARGDREVYTPQVVVNGVTHVVGSDRAAIEHAMSQTRRSGGALSVPVNLALDNGQLTVSVPNASGTQDGEVWLCTLTKSVPVEIGRGENHGHTITYHNVARRWVKLGEWTGKADSWKLPVSELGTDGADAAAVLVQAGNTEKPGAVLGAASTSLH
jgi:hypothetical protein